MTMIGYARVSTSEQNLALQRDALTKMGCETVLEDRASRAKAEAWPRRSPTCAAAMRWSFGSSTGSAARWRT